MYQLEIMCAWCGKYLGAKSAETEVEPRFKVSHGICGPCKTQLLAETDQTLHKRHENHSPVGKEDIYE